MKRRLVPGALGVDNAPGTSRFQGPSSRLNALR